MAWKRFGDDDDHFDYGSLPDAQQQQFLFENLFGDLKDNTARDLFNDVMYNDELSRSQREEAFEQLKDYYLDEYGIQFDDLWDWEDFRAWYDE
jgi:hypothetical protein